MDVLSDIFETIRLRGTLYFRKDFTPPWGTTVPELGKAARFHHVVSGQCYISVDRAPPVMLQSGDFAIVPAGASHVLSGEPAIQAPPLEQVLARAGYRGEGVLALGAGNAAAGTQLVCGHFTFAEGSDHPVLRALPNLIVIPSAARTQRPWFDAVLRLLVEHVFGQHSGADAVVTRLSEIVFFEAIRSAGDEAPQLRQLIQSFADPQIGQAVVLIHRDPKRNWTVEDLALSVGMSRTRFASSFHDAIGTGPITYLAEWRLQRAVQQLRSNRRSISEIAHANGYASAAAFSRAFSGRFGTSPRDWRKSQSIADSA